MGEVSVAHVEVDFLSKPECTQSAEILCPEERIEKNLHPFIQILVEYSRGISVYVTD